MLARTILDRLITEHNESYSRISALLGRNPAYIQQYIKRGSPAVLSAADQGILATHFHMPADFLSSPMTENANPIENLAAMHIRQAIKACDSLDLDIASCHLQHGLDVLTGQSNSHLATQH